LLKISLKLGRAVTFTVPEVWASPQFQMPVLVRVLVNPSTVFDWLAVAMTPV